MSGPAADSVPRQAAAALLAGWIGRHGGSLSGRDLLRLVLDIFGSRVTVCDAVQYVFIYARSQGYDLPAYPLAGCGEIKGFFRDFGVRNIPEFYERIGIGAEEYGRLPEKTLLAMRNMRNERKAFLLDVPFCRVDEAFGRQAHGGQEARIRNRLPSVLDDGQALTLAEGLLAFDLSEGGGDAALF